MGRYATSGVGAADAAFPGHEEDRGLAHLSNNVREDYSGPRPLPYADTRYGATAVQVGQMFIASRG
jgi:hypothetical protein